MRCLWGEEQDFHFNLICLVFLLFLLALVCLNSVPFRLDSPKLYPLAFSSLNSFTHCLNSLWPVPSSPFAGMFFSLKLFLSVVGFFNSPLFHFPSEYRVRLQWHRQTWFGFGISGFV